jgi:hypothetical protein
MECPLPRAKPEIASSLAEVRFEPICDIRLVRFMGVEK